MELLLGMGIGLFVALILACGFCIAKAGSLARALWGLDVAGRVAKEPTLEAKVNAALGASAPQTGTTSPPAAPVGPPPPAKPSGEPLRVLALLQAEARLLDFLLEDISGADDKQLGAGVRDVHAKASAALKKHLVIEPVLSGAEGDRVTVPPGFDPSAIRVIGNVTGQPPFTGELQHPGWKVKELRLPGVAAGQDLFVVQAAEVQV